MATQDHAQSDSVGDTGDGADTDPPGDRRPNPLSEREMDVAAQLVTGATNTEIARELIISPHTVKVHLRNIFEKLDVSSRTEASFVLLQHGWVTVPGVEASELEAVVELIPEPEPLEDVQPTPTLWQKLFLAATLALLLVLLIGPAVMTRTSASSGLLTDANRTEYGQTPPLALPRWSARTPLPYARSRHATVLANETIYIIGGENGDGQTLDSVSAYDLRFNRWRSLANLPEPLANQGSALLAGRIYTAGGSHNPVDAETNAQLSDRLYAYSLEAQEWSDAGVLPTALAGAGLAAYDGALYLMGGWDGESMRDEVWRWRPGASVAESTSWEKVTQLQNPAAFFGEVVVDDDLYVVGGYDGQRELADAAVFNLVTAEWSDLPSMSTPRGGVSAVYDGMAVFALGGGWTKAVDTHERFDALADQWSNFPSPVQGDWRHLGATSRDGRIWMIGGWNGGYLDAHMEYQSAFRALLPVIQSE